LKLVLALAAVAAASVLILPQAVSAQAGPEAAHERFGYPYPDAPDCTERTGTNALCVDDMWGMHQGQCTSWVAFRVNQRNGIPFSIKYRGLRWGHAERWGHVAKRLRIPVTRTPAVGTIAWYASGHVAFVERVNSPTSVVISEMNFDGHNGFREVTITPRDGWPSGFIHVGESDGLGSPGGVRA
jgi:surface antigen